jgi:hypothetical protein
VKKILSIILALGLVLGMTLSAMPAAAQTCEADVTVTPACAEGAATYCIEFESEYQMLVGNDEFVIEFPAGTLGTVTATLNGNATTATKDGMLVYVAIPVAAGNIAAGATVTICISGVTNPAEGEYTLNVWVDMLCCPLELIACGEYEIDPKYSTYKFVVDFGKTYPGIGEDVLPLFKACGQDSPYGFENPIAPDGNLYTWFDIILTYDTLGCFGYDPVIINFWLEDAPAGATVTLVMYGWSPVPYPGGAMTLGWHEFELKLTDLLPKQWGFAPAGFALAADHDEATEAYIHFDIPGNYEICFELEYLGVEIPCQPDIPGGILTDRCLTAEVLQDKDTANIDPFGPKWNFFSTPLRLAYDAIDDVFAPVEHNLKAVWHWDNVQGKWFYYSPTSGLPAGSQPLSTIEDGKGYMVRMKTNYEGFNPIVNPNLWLFGHAQAYAPNPPFSYNVVTGWTMMGYTSLTPLGDATTYLAPATALAGGVLGLSGNAYVPVTQFNPGFGYWVYFTAPGTVVP